MKVWKLFQVKIFVYFSILVSTLLWGCITGRENSSETGIQIANSTTNPVATNLPTLSVSDEAEQFESTSQAADQAFENTQPAESSQAERMTPKVEETDAVIVKPDRLLADVISVQVSGEVGTYQFSVSIRSPDTGCEQYADWWEVVGEDGSLVYRRVLLHSHVQEQPFTRSGEPVAISADQVVWVRAHMKPGGYGGLAFKGSPQTGFAEAELLPNFATDLEEMPPLPRDCAF